MPTPTLTERIGPLGARVARNIAAIRAARQMTVRGMAQQLADIDHPIAASGISKMEHRQRAITVDDLQAIATVLDVDTATLLSETVRITVAVSGA